MTTWIAEKAAGFTASEATCGPYLLAAYGMARRYSWEVARGGRRRRVIAQGEAASLAAAQEAAERAALTSPATAQRGPRGACRRHRPDPRTIGH